MNHSFNHSHISLSNSQPFCLMANKMKHCLLETLCHWLNVNELWAVPTVIFRGWKRLNYPAFHEKKQQLKKSLENKTFLCSRCFAASFLSYWPSYDSFKGSRPTKLGTTALHDGLNAVSRPSQHCQVHHSGGKLTKSL